MKVKDLIKALAAFDEDLTVAVEWCSDFAAVNSLEIAEGLDRDYYIMRWHKSISDEQPMKFLLLSVHLNI